MRGLGLKFGHDKARAGPIPYAVLDFAWREGFANRVCVPEGRCRRQIAGLGVWGRLPPARESLRISYRASRRVNSARQWPWFIATLQLLTEIRHDGGTMWFFHQQTVKFG